MTRNCKLCSKTFNGRSDKIFCTAFCKAEYHIKLQKASKIHTSKIDKILHRNHAIFMEILGKNKSQKKVMRLILDRKKFNFKYHTHTYTNSQGKTYYYVYNFGWMEFSDQEILIIKRS